MGFGSRAHLHVSLEASGVIALEPRVAVIDHHVLAVQVDVLEGHAVVLHRGPRALHSVSSGDRTQHRQCARYHQRRERDQQANERHCVR